MSEVLQKPGEKRFFRDVLTVAGYGSAFAAIPLFASMKNLQPPWPPSIAYVSSAIILVAAVLAWEFGPAVTAKQRRRMLLLATTLMIIGLFSYLTLYSNFVVTLSDGRVIRGYECNPATLAIYPQCPDLGELELERASAKPEWLFTARSLTIVRVSLVAAWLVFVGGLLAAVAWAVAGRRGTVAAAPVAGDRASS